MILAAGAAEASADTFTELMNHVGQGFEALGAAILVVGFIWSFVLAAVAVRRSGWTAKAYLVLRQAFGGTLLLGLEVLVPPTWCTPSRSRPPWTMSSYSG